MAEKGIIAICQSGGEFMTDGDGSMTYKGGEAYAVDLTQQTKLSAFKVELVETFGDNVSGMSIKYFLPGNKKNLITVSKDKDLKRLIAYYNNSNEVEVYLLEEEAVTPNASKTPARRSRKTTTLSEEVVVPVQPLNVVPSNEPQAIEPSNEPLTIEPPNDTTDMDIATETTTPSNALVSNDDKHGKITLYWGDGISGVGQRFCSFNEFLQALRKYSVSQGFAYTYKKKDSHRVVVRCKSEGCPWHIYVSRLPTTQLIYIRKMNAVHTCEGDANKASYRATRGWVENIIKDKLRVSPNYTAKDIASDIKREYGIDLSYSRARRAKESAREQLQGSHKDAYKLLPLFCVKIKEINPGSVATYNTKEDSSFHRLFVAFHASISGFQQGCRPLLFLNSTPINSKYQGMLLAATAVDGDDGLFPLAFAIVDMETDVNWRWFLLELKSALSTPDQITFVADFQKGLKESLRDIYGQQCYHGYCLRSLVEKLDNDLKGQFSHEARHLFVEDLYAAANAAKLDDFERVIENIRSMSPSAYNWVIQSEPEHWATVFFGGARYNHITSEFGQQFYSWLSKANELTLIQMVNMIRSKIMEFISTRRAIASQLVSRLTPSMEEKLQNEISKAHPFHVLLRHGSTYEVRSDSVDAVDVNRWDCSCKSWQLTGLPCCHAIACFRWLDRSPYDYCSRYFSATSYQLSYAQSINPIPIIERPEDSESASLAICITPPLTKRPPGRPKMIQSGPVDIVRRQKRCSNCKKLGHTKRSCK